MTTIEQQVRDAVSHTPEPEVVPDWMSVVRRSRVVKRRRRIGQALAALSVVVAGAVVVVLVTNRSPQSANRSIVATPDPSTAALGVSARPVLEGCTATAAFETVVKGTSQVQGPEPIPGEVFADPTRGVSGPLAVVIRQPDAKSLGLIANAQINGRDANVQMGDNLQGGAMWVLASGGTADLYSQGLTEDEIRVLAEQVDSGGAALPENLRSIGMTDVASRSTSQCMVQHGEFASISEIRGSQPSRYAEAMTPGGDNVRRFDEGDKTFVIARDTPGGFDVETATYHEATPEQWQQLLDCTPPASSEACASANSTTTAP